MALHLPLRGESSLGTCHGAGPCLLRMLPRRAMSLALVPSGTSALAPPWVPPSVLGLQSHVENSDCCGGSGTLSLPAPSTAPGLLGSPPGLKAGGLLWLVARASTFSVLQQGLDFGNSEARESDSGVVCILLCYPWSAACPAAPSSWGLGGAGRACRGVGWGGDPGNSGERGTGGYLDMLSYHVLTRK